MTTMMSMSTLIVTDIECRLMLHDLSDVDGFISRIAEVHTSYIVIW